MATRRKHPDARAAELRLSASVRGAEIMPATGWRWPYGWRIRMWARDGGFRERYLGPEIAYAEAHARYLDEMKNPDIESGDLTRIEAHHVAA